MAIVVYRNYDCDSTLLLEMTPFQSDHLKLNRFLNSVEATGGWEKEAIQVCFQAINQMSDVDQVILIGDAPGNTNKEVSEKRKNRGEKYWNKNGFPSTTLDK